MKYLVSIAVFSILPKLYYGSTQCGNWYTLNSPNNVHHFDSGIGTFRNGSMTECPRKDIHDDVKEGVRKTSTSFLEDGPTILSDRTICATLLLRNYTSYLGWRLEQVNICGPKEKINCEALINRETKFGITVEECFNYPCREDDCTIRFTVKKPFEDSQYLLCSAFVLILLVVTMLQKCGKLDVYEY